MSSSRALPVLSFVVLLFGATALVSMDSVSHAGDQSGLEASAPSLTRIFYLQDMDTREATTLLRAEVQVRRLVAFSDLGIVVVGGEAKPVDLAEHLLRERGALNRAVEPHAPMLLDDLFNDSPQETRVFRIEGLDPKGVVIALRSLYVIRDLTLLDDGHSVSVRSTAAKLDAASALLKELGVLAETTPPVQR